MPSVPDIQELLDEYFRSPWQKLRDPGGVVHRRWGRDLRTACEDDDRETYWRGEELPPVDEEVSCLRCLCLR